MIVGYEGQLVGEQFLDAHLAAEGACGQVAAVARAWRAGHAGLGPASSLRTIVETAAAPLLRALGHSLRDHGQRGTVAYMSTADPRARLGVLVLPWGEPPAPHRAAAVRFALAEQAPWCLLFNGTHLRLVPARSASRRYLEFELDAAADESRTAHALWTLLHHDAVAGSDGRPSLADLVAGSNRHAAGVAASLRSGVLEASEHFLGALLAGAPATAPDEGFGQALTLVYRVLFLLFAEARALLPVWHPVYQESYAVGRLCHQAQRSSTPGLWDALGAISRLSHAGCSAGDLRITPFNGRLFAPARTFLADRPHLDDELARRSLIALSTRPAEDGEGRVQVSYRELGVEQLGAVYETLLDYGPVVGDADPRPPEGTKRRSARRRQVFLRPGSGARKRTGSFYTPASLTRYVIEQTLGPLVRERPLDQILSLRVLDPAMGSGAFLVGACEYLAEACEAALIRDERCHPSDIGPADRAALRRQVSERCLFGVDLNPMAVQLARLSLWLSTLAADKPLSFLDHHLRVGDSLLGTWLHCLDRPPRRQRGTGVLPLFDIDGLEASLRVSVPARRSLTTGSATLADIRAKEQSLAQLERADSPLGRWKRAADLWCAAWFCPELADQSRTFLALCDVIFERDGPLPPATAGPLLARAARAATEHAFFHWELEFPEVYFDASGQRLARPGFDAIIGNPPWDMMRADEQDTTERARGIAAMVRFSRDAGVYRAQSDGHANRYQLFLERSLALLTGDGRIGMVLPSGLIADQGSAALRRHLFSRCSVETIVGFDNRRAVFPIHRSVRFVLLTAQSGTPTAAFRCRLGESDPAVLDETASTADHAPGLRLDLDLLQTISGAGLAVPDLRSRLDAQIAEHTARRFAALGDAAGWHARFGRELNGSDDRALFVAAGGAATWPVIDGRHLEPFRVNVQASTRSVSRTQASRRLGQRHLATRLAYRDVASASNRTTLIAAMLPAGSVSTHTVFCLRTALPIRVQWFLCGLFNSLTVNYLVRLRVTSHVTTAIVEGLPVPGATDAGGAVRSIAAMARALARRQTPQMWSCLNATVARLYGLTHEEFSHLLATFPLIDAGERRAALERFARRG